MEWRFWDLLRGPDRTWGGDQGHLGSSPGFAQKRPQETLATFPHLAGPSLPHQDLRPLSSLVSGWWVQGKSWGGGGRQVIQAAPGQPVSREDHFFLHLLRFAM